MTNEILLKLVTQPVQLTLVEISFPGYFIEQRDPTPLAKLLQSFEGLRDLFILYPYEWRTAVEYLHAVSHHRSSLRRLVYQQSRSDGPTGDETVTGLIEILTELEKVQCLGIGCKTDDLSPTSADN